VNTIIRFVGIGTDNGSKEGGSKDKRFPVFQTNIQVNDKYPSSSQFQEHINTLKTSKGNDVLAHVYLDESIVHSIICLYCICAALVSFGNISSLFKCASFSLPS
jgi:hypothetical protein